jgi:TonB family protein
MDEFCLAGTSRLTQAVRAKKPAAGPNQADVTPPRFLIDLEPAHRVFFRNLRDTILPPKRERLRLTSWPGTFWPDVFVKRPLPWKGLAESSVFHAVVLAALIGGSLLWPQRTRLADAPVFHKEDVVYYSPDEYLQPIDTGSAKVSVKQKGDPEKAPQPIISVPAEADNRRQTIVTPPKLKLNQDVPLPNIVAMANTSKPIAPAPTTERKLSDLALPELATPVVAPAPSPSSDNLRRAPSLAAPVVSPAPDVQAAMPMTRRDPQAPQPAVVEPPPDVASTANRLGAINIGHAQVIEPAPQLAVPAQRAVPPMAAGFGGAAVVPPPPTVSSPSSGAGGGRLVALNVRPSAPAAVDPPSGNRRGTFAATPEGRVGAAGTPESPNGDAAHGASAGNNAKDLPAGLKVGAAPPTAGSGTTAGTPRLLADAQPPRVSSLPRATDSPVTTPSELDRQIFGDRKLYSMTLNMPNLNSAGGSWVIRFAELGQPSKGELVAPEATQKVDPGYPIELMKHNVHGTVTLYAVIASDGSVGSIRVLRGVDDRLDAYAAAALARCKFRPATKNGNAIPLEAVVMIPFRPARF